MDWDALSAQARTDGRAACPLSVPEGEDRGQTIWDTGITYADAIANAVPDTEVLPLFAASPEARDWDAQINDEFGPEDFDGPLDRARLCLSRAIYDEWREAYHHAQEEATTYWACVTEDSTIDALFDQQFAAESYLTRYGDDDETGDPYLWLETLSHDDVRTRLGLIPVYLPWYRADHTDSRTEAAEQED